MKKIYNKLVRDNIPDIIREKGNDCTVEILDKEKYLEALDEKLFEELSEYQVDRTLEELADLIEVIYSVAIARGYSLEELEAVRVKKLGKRGGFKNKILLKEVFEAE